MVSQEALNEFKQIYKQEFGVELDDQEALVKAERLLGLFKAIYRPIPKDSPFLKRRVYARAKDGTKNQG